MVVDLSKDYQKPSDCRVSACLQRGYCLLWDFVLSPRLYNISTQDLIKNRGSFTSGRKQADS